MNYMNDLKIFSVSEYVEYLNESLYERDAVVEGEVSEYRVNQQKWIFFKVKDEDAVLECFGTVFRIKFPLEDGMRVRLYGRPKIYAKTGKLSMNVEWVEPSGVGALKRAFELLKKELEKEGLFALERKRPLPEFPKRIGLIASKESAAYGDFIKVLKHRFGGIEIYFSHVQVQGADAIPNIVEAFEYFNQNQKGLGLDLVVLIRGGGSLEDLSAFNSRDVAYAVFGSVAPVVCGVGHEQDESLADYVADVRASTPSNAAELITPDREDVLRRLEYMEGRIAGGTDDLYERQVQKVDDFLYQLDSFMNAKKEKLAALAGRLELNLKFFEERIIMQKSKIDNFVRLIQSFSPKAVLQRGYAIIKKKGQVISSIKDLKLKVQATIQGDQIRISAKSKDDLQTVISVARKNNYGIALQFVNYR